MKSLILILIALLAVPAYAQQMPDDKAADALTHLADVVEATMNKPKPLDSTDEQLVKDALDDVNKTLKDFYKIGKKKSPLKKVGSVAGKGIMAFAGTFNRSGGYYSGYNPNNMGMPQMYVTPSGAYTVTNMGMGFTNIMGPPGGFGGMQPMGFMH